MFRRPILPVMAAFLLIVVPATAQAKGYLGVQIRLNPDGKEILIMEIMENSAAEKAKLKTNDVIVKIDGTEPTSIKQFIGILELKQPGDEVTLDILRDGKEEKVKVTLGKMSGRTNIGTSCQQGEPRCVSTPGAHAPRLAP